MRRNRDYHFLIKGKLKIQEWYQDLDIKKWLITNIPFIIIFLVADRGAYLYRHVSGNIGTKIMYLLENMNLILGIIPSFYIVDLAVGAGVAAVLKLMMLQKRAEAKKFRKGEEYGSARWGTREDIKPYMDPDFWNNIPLTATESITMESRPKNPKYARNKNIMVIGGSGSGKT